MTDLHPSIAHIPLPDRIARLFRDHRGYPVPWFVEWLDAADHPCAAGEGRADFRLMNPAKLGRAVRERRCWICGEVLGGWLAFVVGPMCGVNRISSEPPSHVSCAEYAAHACPFLVMPKMRRREAGLPEAAVAHREAETQELPPELQIAGISAGGAGGFAITRNPGVALVWVTRRYRLEHDERGGIVFHMGDAERTTWWCEGRPATRAEVLHSIETGLPFLEAACDSEAPHRRADARRALTRAVDAAQRYLPVDEGIAS